MFSEIGVSDSTSELRVQHLRWRWVLLLYDLCSWWVWAFQGAPMDEFRKEPWMRGATGAQGSADSDGAQ